jgi:hypothetical protein
MCFFFGYVLWCNLRHDILWWWWTKKKGENKDFDHFLDLIFLKLIFESGLNYFDSPHQTLFIYTCLCFLISLEKMKLSKIVCTFDEKIGRLCTLEFSPIKFIFIQSSLSISILVSVLGLLPSLAEPAAATATFSNCKYRFTLGRDICSFFLFHNSSTLFWSSFAFFVARFPAAAGLVSPFYRCWPPI